MTSPLSLASFNNAKEALDLLEQVSDAFWEQFKVHESIELTIAASCKPSLKPKPYFDTYELRLFFRTSEPEQVEQARWFLSYVNSSRS